MFCSDATPENELNAPSGMENARGNIDPIASGCHFVPFQVMTSPSATPCVMSISLAPLMLPLAPGGPAGHFRFSSQCGLAGSPDTTMELAVVPLGSSRLMDGVMLGTGPGGPAVPMALACRLVPDHW